MENDILSPNVDHKTWNIAAKHIERWVCQSVGEKPTIIWHLPKEVQSEAAFLNQIAVRVIDTSLKRLAAGKPFGVSQTKKQLELGLTPSMAAELEVVLKAIVKERLRDVAKQLERSQEAYL